MTTPTRPARPPTRRAGWPTLLAICLATACDVPPYDIGYEDFADAVAGHTEGTPFEDARVEQLIEAPVRPGGRGPGRV